MSPSDLPAIYSITKAQRY